MRVVEPDLIRQGTVADYPGIATVFFRAVSEGAASHYDAVQRLAWGRPAPDVALWADRLAGLDLWVAQDCAGQITGFISLRAADGLLDHLFVLPERRRSFLARRLLDTLNAKAAEYALPRLWAEASLLARPFLERQGWHVVMAQEVPCRGTLIRNFVMEWHRP